MAEERARGDDDLASLLPVSLLTLLLLVLVLDSLECNQLNTSSLPTPYALLPRLSLSSPRPLHLSTTCAATSVNNRGGEIQAFVQTV